MRSSFKCVTHLVNGVQFLKQTFVLLPPPTNAIFPVTKIYASEKSIKFGLITSVLNFMVESFSSPFRY